MRGISSVVGGGSGAALSAFSGAAIDGFTTSADDLTAGNLVTGPWAFANNTWGVLLMSNPRAAGANPSLWMANTHFAVSGWQIYDAGNGAMKLGCPNGAGTTISIGSSKKGMTCIAWAVRSDGHVITSIDGALAVDNGANTFATPDGSSSRIIGSTVPGPGNFYSPSTASFVEYALGTITGSPSNAVVAAAVQAMSSTSLPYTDSVLTAWGTISGLVGAAQTAFLKSNVPPNRFRIADYWRNNVSGNFAVSDNLSVQRDVSSLASIVAGNGSAATTWTKNGANPTIVAGGGSYSEKFPAAALYGTPQLTVATGNAGQVLDSITPVQSAIGQPVLSSRYKVEYGTTPSGYVDFATVVTSNAAAIGASDTSDKPGWKLDGTDQGHIVRASTNDIPTDGTVHVVWKSLEAITAATATHTLEVVGPASNNSSDVRSGISVLGLSQPIGQTFPIPTPSKVLVVLGGDETAGTDALSATGYHGEVGYFRTDFPTSGTGRVLMEGDEFGTFHEYFAADATGTTLANKLIALANLYPGVTTKTLFIDGGLAFWDTSIGGTWVTTDLGTFLRAVLQAVIANGAFNGGIFVGEPWQSGMSGMITQIQTACSGLAVTRITAATRQAGGVVQSTNEAWSTAATFVNLKSSDKTAIGY